jgi:hypothetical protein
VRELYYHPVYAGLLRFFGHVAHRQPRAVLVTYPDFARAFLRMCLHYADLDAAQRLLAFDTLAIVAATGEGKTALDELYGELCVLSCTMCHEQVRNWRTYCRGCGMLLVRDRMNCVCGTWTPLRRQSPPIVPIYQRNVLHRCVSLGVSVDDIDSHVCTEVDVAHAQLW